METLAHSDNGIEIVYDSTSSHIATHFADTPELKSAVIVALEATNVTGNPMFFEYAFDHIIGTTDLVVTNDKDEIIFAKRKNRDTFTRFTMSRQPEPCSTVTIFLKKQNEVQYQLWSAWVGYKGPSFPGDENETPESKPYWSKHALVWGRQEIHEGTETTTSPW